MFDLGDVSSWSFDARTFHGPCTLRLRTGASCSVYDKRGTELSLPAFREVRCSVAEGDSVMLSGQYRLAFTGGVLPASDEPSFTTLDPPSRQDVDPAFAAMFARVRANEEAMRRQLQELREKLAQRV